MKTYLYNTLLLLVTKCKAEIVDYNQGALYGLSCYSSVQMYMQKLHTSLQHPAHTQTKHIDLLHHSPASIVAL